MGAGNKPVEKKLRKPRRQRKKLTGSKKKEEAEGEEA